MSFASSHENTRKTPEPDSGAMAAWGLIGGAVLGGAIGAFLHKAMIGALTLAVIGWIVGAVIDRARR